MVNVIKSFESQRATSRPVISKKQTGNTAQISTAPPVTNPKKNLAYSQRVGLRLGYPPSVQALR